MSSITSPRQLHPVDGIVERRINSVGLISWGAILGGVVASLVVQLVLSMLGAGIGLATINPTSAGTPSASSLSIGAVAWLIVSGIVASSVGGFLAGRLGGRQSDTGGYHGFIAWASGTLVIVFLISSAASGLASGAFGAVSSVLSGAGHVVGSTLQTAAETAVPGLAQGGNPISAIEDQVRTATNDQDPAALRAEAAKAVGAVLSGNIPNQKEAMDRAADLLAKARGIPVDQAKTQIEQFQQQYRATLADAQVKAAVAAENAARASASAAIVSALALVLGAVASVFAGRRGAATPAA